MTLVQTVGSKVLEVSLSVLVPVIGALVTAVLTRYLQKLNVTLTDAQQAQLKQSVTNAIQAVEEQSRRGDVLTSDTKNKIAVELVKAQHPDKSAVEIQHNIDAALPEIRAKLAPVPSTPANFGLNEKP